MIEELKDGKIKINYEFFQENFQVFDKNLIYLDFENVKYIVHKDELKLCNLVNNKVLVVNLYKKQKIETAKNKKGKKDE